MKSHKRELNTLVFFESLPCFCSILPSLRVRISYTFLNYTLFCVFDFVFMQRLSHPGFQTPRQGELRLLWES